MFSGLVRKIAKVTKLENSILTLHTDYHPNIGDSIAVNGVCLTVIKCLNDGFSLELSLHTQKIIAMERFKIGSSVHIEPALKASDRLDGHFVQGHIDGIGNIKDIKPIANQTEIIIQTTPQILSFCIPKGSISIDGISLTLGEIREETFKLVLIPHTLENTLFKEYRKGMRVNIETDMIVRSISHLLQKQNLFQKTHLAFDWKMIDGINLFY